MSAADYNRALALAGARPEMTCLKSCCGILSLSWRCLFSILIVLSILKDQMRNFIGWFLKVLKQWRTRHWTLIDGVVTTVDFEKATHINTIYGHEAWIFELLYSYQINGVEYRGRSKTEPWYMGLRPALATQDDLVGKRVRVRYKPDVPAKSTWLPLDGGSGQLSAPIQFQHASQRAS